MAADTALETPTMRRSVEHHRLTLCISRLERVVAALEVRADAHRARADVPAPLRLALNDFRRKLDAVRRQLEQGDDTLHHRMRTGA
ncbi:MAG: hypothetical protein JWP18_791 [Solirubrobacterales bacterium]|jgi:hypothetical protein|nr:hypothetical protein [Solirubrobacterales bacterium]